jgi:hypothetical protein
MLSCFLPKGEQCDMKIPIIYNYKILYYRLRPHYEYIFQVSISIFTLLPSHASNILVLNGK